MKYPYIVLLILACTATFFIGAFLTASPAPDLTSQQIQEMNKITGLHRPSTNAEKWMQILLHQN